MHCTQYKNDEQQQNQQKKNVERVDKIKEKKNSWKRREVERNEKKMKQQKIHINCDDVKTIRVFVLCCASQQNSFVFACTYRKQVTFLLFLLLHFSSVGVAFMCFICNNFNVYLKCANSYVAVYPYQWHILLICRNICIHNKKLKWRTNEK